MDRDEEIKSVFAKHGLSNVKVMPETEGYLVMDADPKHRNAEGKQAAVFVSHATGIEIPALTLVALLENAGIEVLNA